MGRRNVIGGESSGQLRHLLLWFPLLDGSYLSILDTMVEFIGIRKEAPWFGIRQMVVYVTMIDFAYLLMVSLVRSYILLRIVPDLYDQPYNSTVSTVFSAHLHQWQTNKANVGSIAWKIIESCSRSLPS